MIGSDDGRPIPLARTIVLTEPGRVAVDGPFPDVHGPVLAPGLIEGDPDDDRGMVLQMVDHPLQFGHEHVQHITQTGSGIAYTVSQVQPALFGFNGRGALAVFYFFDGVVHLAVDNHFGFHFGFGHVIHQTPTDTAAGTDADGWVGPITQRDGGSYRDAIRFANGAEVLLQQLGVGVKIRVVDALQAPLHGQEWWPVVKRKRDPELV